MKIELFCDICSFSALYKKSIKEHKAQVHYRHKHACGLCCEQFDTKPKLKKHQQKHEEQQKAHEEQQKAHEETPSVFINESTGMKIEN